MRAILTYDNDTDSDEVEFMGLMHDDRGDIQAVVRHSGHGMMLMTYHPSRVELCVDTVTLLEDRCTT